MSKLLMNLSFYHKLLEAIKQFSTSFSQNSYCHQSARDQQKTNDRKRFRKSTSTFTRKNSINIGGKIDAIYHAPQLAEENSTMRKPNIGMALQAAKKEFPSIDFKKSIMVGDSISDMEFAKNTNMLGVLIGESEKYFCTDSLISLSKLTLELNSFFNMVLISIMSISRNHLSNETR